jgi:hypothetical protein
MRSRFKAHLKSRADISHVAPAPFALTTSSVAEQSFRSAAAMSAPAAPRYRAVLARCHALHR